MLKRGLVLVMSFAMVSSAFAGAGATVELVVTDFGNTPCNGATGCTFSPLSGPFDPGQSVLVHVMVTASQDLLLRGVQIDSNGSSPELILGTEIDAVNSPITDPPIPNFWFDYSPITIFNTFAQGTYPATGIDPQAGPSTGGYTDFSDLRQGDPLIDWVASTVWAASGELPGMLAMQAGVPYRIGGMVVTLPSGRGGGEFTLDVLNLANTDDSNFGMVIDFGFGTNPDTDPVVKWASAAQGDGVDAPITYGPGGPLTLTVIPEPATLILLGLGGLAALRRRRS